MKFKFTTILLAAAAAAVGACTPIPEISKQNPFMARVSPAWVRNLEDRGEPIIINTALIHGRVAVVDGCVAIGGEEPALLIFWPTERLVRTKKGYAIRAGDGELIAIGQYIEGSGGGSDQIPENLEAGVPERCRFGTYISIHGAKRANPFGPPLPPPETPWRVLED